MPRNTDVILIQDVLKLGNMGDLVAVKPGYARNFLLPQGLAIHADRAAKRQVEILRERAKANEVVRLGQAKELSKKLNGKTLRIAAKVAHDDVLFGSVGIRDIVRVLAVDGYTVDQRQVHLHQNIKRLGRYEVEVSLHAEVPVKIVLEVADADPNGRKLDEILAATAAQSEAAADDEADAEPVGAAAGDAKAAAKGDKADKPEKPAKAGKGKAAKA
jgi:large subunit ribosomal protein L9